MSIFEAPVSAVITQRRRRLSEYKLICLSIAADRPLNLLTKPHNPLQIDTAIALPLGNAALHFCFLLIRDGKSSDFVEVVSSLMAHPKARGCDVLDELVVVLPLGCPLVAHLPAI